MNAKSIFDAGFRAYRAGVPNTRNPYVATTPIGRAKRATWKAGWEQARKVAEETTR